jgi:hypothetical protein
VLEVEFAAAKLDLIGVDLERGLVFFGEGELERGLAGIGRS